MHINYVDMVTPPEQGHCPESVHELFAISLCCPCYCWAGVALHIGHWTVFMKLGNISILMPTYLYMYKGSNLCVPHAHLVEFACWQCITIYKHIFLVTHVQIQYNQSILAFNCSKACNERVTTCK